MRSFLGVFVLNAVFWMLCSILTLSPVWAGCPLPEQIQRVPGHQQWQVPEGWVGRFISPRVGHGHSQKIKRFLKARWIQLNHLPDSPGKLMCHYEGDAFGEHIELAQFEREVALKPTGQNWRCALSAEFPNTVCECTGQAAACQVIRLK